MTKTPLDFLTELEQVNLQQVADNSVALEAIRKVLFDQILNQGLQKQGEDTLHARNWVFGIDPTGKMGDDQFGRSVRNMTDALIIVERAFNTILGLKTKEEKPKKEKNPAR